MLNLSTGYKSSILGPASFVDLFRGASLNVYSGDRPLTPDMPAPELLRLAKVVRDGFDGGLTFEQNGPYIQQPIGQRWNMMIDTTGNAQWFRLMAAGDTNDLSYIAPRIDGDISQITGLGELFLQNQSVVRGTAVPIDSFLFTVAPYIGA
jgi:hypothetical protein